MSNISEADLEFLLELYVAAKIHIPEKFREKWADDFLLKLKDFGIEIRLNSDEIVATDEYLDHAFDVIMNESEGEDEDWYAEDEDEDY